MALSKAACRECHENWAGWTAECDREWEERGAVYCWRIAGCPQENRCPVIRTYREPPPQCPYRGRHAAEADSKAEEAKA